MAIVFIFIPCKGLFFHVSTIIFTRIESESNLFAVYTGVARCSSLSSSSCHCCFFCSEHRWDLSVSQFSMLSCLEREGILCYHLFVVIKINASCQRLNVFETSTSGERFCHCIHFWQFQQTTKRSCFSFQFQTPFFNIASCYSFPCCFTWTPPTHRNSIKQMNFINVKDFSSTSQRFYTWKRKRSDCRKISNWKGLFK